MTLLAIVQEFCKRTALPVPAVLFGSQDDQITQLVGLANEGLEDLYTRHVWGKVQEEALHTTLAAEDQGAIADITSDGFLFIIDNAIWDRTTNLKLTGPVSASTWQELKSGGIGGPAYSWRIRGGQLLLLPAPPAGHVLAFEYANSNLVRNAAGTATTRLFAADADTFLLDDRLLLLWLRWRWKKEKEFPYSEEFRQYEFALNQAAGQDNEGRVLDMSDSAVTGPGIFVPAGSWPL